MNEQERTNAQRVLDVLTGTTAPTINMNLEFDNSTIAKIVGGAVLAGIVIIILNRIAVKLF